MAVPFGDPILSKDGNRVIFIDFGAVPVYGYPEASRVVLEKLRSLHKQYLQSASLIVPISRFLAQSQSRLDSDNVVPVRPILLGADHLESAVWPAAELNLNSCGSALKTVTSLKRQGKKNSALPRWLEPDCHNNSQAALGSVEQLSKQHPNPVLVVLEDASRFEAPAHLRSAIVPIGFPDDEDLIDIIKQTDLGLSFSLWEGFNLSLAEMQWFERPALAFDVGAHPEVIAHRWYLCEHATEMAHKAAELLAGGGPSQEASPKVSELRETSYACLR